MGIHAGLEETSLLLHLRPDLVDMAGARSNVPLDHQSRYAHLGFGRPARAAWLSRDFGPSGVIGDPTRATPERGRELFEAMVATLGATLAEVARFDFEPTSSTSQGGLA
jgi:creatinine amidohydrolase